MKNKLILLLTLAFLATTLLAGCAKKEEVATQETPAATTETPAATTEEAPATEAPAANADGSLADGVYFAVQDAYPTDNVWKTTVTITVAGGKITAVDYNGISKEAGATKKEASKAGNYPMVAKGGAKAEYFEQAALVEAYLIQTQDPTAITYTDDSGKTDAISGVSIKVKDFFDLAAIALSKAPVGTGPYKDGAYHAETSAFENGWKDTIDITVLNGFIQSVSWNGYNEKDATLTKKAAEADGQYAMVEQGGAKDTWTNQTALVQEYLIKTQDPTGINYTDDQGHTDAISGVSIKVGEFFKLAEEALKSAK